MFTKSFYGINLREIFGVKNVHYNVHRRVVIYLQPFKVHKNVKFMRCY